MPARRSRAKKPATVRIRDLVEADSLVICVDSFRPSAVSRLISRGDYVRLSDPVVQRYPAFFAFIVPLERLDDLREIGRDAVA